MDELIKRLNSPDEAERLYAVEDFSAKSGPEVAVHLAKRLAVEDSPLVRDALVFSLKKKDCTLAYDILFEMFVSPDASIRNAAVGIFGAGGDDAVAFLTSRLDHADKEVRKLLLDALFETGTPDALLAIRAGLHDPEPNVKITAVEYLGALGDTESIDEMMNLFKRDSEPMLRAAILEAFSRVAKGEGVDKILAILNPEGDLYDIDAFYLPQLLDLMAKSGELEDVVKVMKALPVNLYGEDIVRAVLELKKRFGDVLNNKDIYEKVVEIIENKEAKEEARYNAVECLISSESSPVDAHTLYSLGLALVSESGFMLYPGVRLLSRSGLEDARERIKEICETTEDDDLKEFCMELIRGN